MGNVHDVPLVRIARHNLSDTEAVAMAKRMLFGIALVAIVIALAVLSS